MKPYPAHIIGLFGLLTSLSLASADDQLKGPASAVTYREISRRVVDLGDHTASYVKVRPPVLPKAPPPPSPRPLTEAERARREELEKKAHVTLSVSATVYLNGERAITELRWRDESGELSYRAYSNADFRYLRQLSHFESETTVYSWFPFFVDACDLAEWPDSQPSPLPSGLQFSSAQAEYILDERSRSLADQETTLTGLDYLHSYYQIFYKELKSDYEKRTAEQAERERQLRENPPEPANTTLRFWPKTFPQR